MAGNLSPGDASSSPHQTFPRHLHNSTPIPTHTSTTADMASWAEQERRWADRHSEETLNAALAAAQAQHTSVRERALEVLALAKMEKKLKKITAQAEAAERKTQVDLEYRMMEIKIREEENRQKLVPQVPARVPTPPSVSITAPTPATATLLTPAKTPSAPVATTSNNQAKVDFSVGGKSAVVPAANPPSGGDLASSTTNSAASTSTSIPQSASISQAVPTPNVSGPPANLSTNPPFQRTPPPVAALQKRQTQSNGNQQTDPAAPHPQGASSQPQYPSHTEHLHQNIQRYDQIHKSLKQLRMTIKECGVGQPEFRKKAGEMRRTIIMSMGQLTEGKGVNQAQVNKIQSTIKSSWSAGGPLIAPNIFMAKPNMNEEGKFNNDQNLPMLPIYLLNILAKAGISQLVSEAGANPKTAEPIGIVLVTIFSADDFLWRGNSFIDILLAKYRVVCPVLFGIRGNEKTDQGRARLGWKKLGGNAWVSEQEHNDRMIGLGAGFAAISLRKYPKTRLNPCPPHVYWSALASICTTPAEETSSTQFVVVKSMIDNHVETFLRFYGHMGYWALYVALADFAYRASEENVAASSLRVLAEKIKRDTGLIFLN